MSQWSSSQYGGNGNFATSQSPMGATPSTGAKAGYADDCLLPVTVKMINEAETTADGSSKMINGRKVSFVKIMGLLRGIEEKAAFKSYKVEDSTGVIDVRVWQSEEDEAPQNVREGNYVKVVGKCAVFNGSTQVNGYAISAMDTYNAYIHHMISVAYTHLSNSKACQEAGTVTEGEAGQYAMSTVGKGSAGAGDDQALSNMGPVAKAVYNHVQRAQEGNENGVHIPTIMAALSQYSADQIRDSILSLTNDGMVYDTVDDTWIKTTSGDD